MIKDSKEGEVIQIQKMRTINARKLIILQMKRIMQMIIKNPRKLKILQMRRMILMIIKNLRNLKRKSPQQIMYYYNNNVKCPISSIQMVEINYINFMKIQIYYLFDQGITLLSLSCYYIVIVFLSVSCVLFRIFCLLSIFCIKFEFGLDTKRIQVKGRLIDFHSRCVSSNLTIRSMYSGLVSSFT